MSFKEGNAMNILVTGGAGYIGSHMVKMLLDEGHQVTVVDDLSNGYRDAVLGGRFIQADICDPAILDDLFSSTRFNAVMHFAAFIEVGESVKHPEKYYANNTAKTMYLLEAMARHGVRNFVFSSTAAVYGEPETVPILEDHPRKPVNAYGNSKYMVEQELEEMSRVDKLRYVSLRYFNAAGAHPDGILGERHDPESHLIPLVLQAASGRREAISVYGKDYDTPDGAAVRDYIHVVDLCNAHLLALLHLQGKGKSAVYNLGNGNGFSVQEVIQTVKRVTGREFRVIDAPRRPGDSAVLVAESTRARKELGWTPRYPELETIVQHAWAWEQQMAKQQLQKTGS
jgi:UDP-glucose 4-epimerase